jgi:general L-amino acid transport system permease protein
MSNYAYVRTEDAPVLKAPRSMVGVRGWMRANLFSSPLNSILTLIFGSLALYLIWLAIDWAFFRASWTGSDREACTFENVGACWPYAKAKFMQWIYGFYPIDQRWRATTVMLLGAAALVPMLIPSAPFKKWNVLFLLVAFPIIATILLSGGNLNLSALTYLAAIVIFLALAALVPVAAYGLESGMKKNRIGALLVLVGILPLVAAFVLFVVDAIVTLLGTLALKAGMPAIASLFTDFAGLLSRLSDLTLAIPYLEVVTTIAIAAGALLSLFSAWRGGSVARQPILYWGIALAALLFILFLLDFDFGLTPVDTNDWGGLLVTLVVSLTGITLSLPLGILLALGRRSGMPVIKGFSVLFIELWRGVPLITVLFMASVMLPLFFPAGTNFDKLIRVLIGITLFSAAYMAEVVRGGLQSIPKGQYEGAMALGLSYWQMTANIILPQALKVSIPNIVGNFIGLFKDTTLVTIIGLFDLWGIIKAGAADAKWASPATEPTGYFIAAVMFWVFCFSMSRYAAFIERRLHTGHKR